MSIIPQDMRVNRKCHRQQFRIKKQYWNIIDKVIRMFEQRPIFKPEVFKRTFTVYVDASDNRLGYYTN